MGWKLERVDTKLTESEEQEFCIYLEPEKRSAIHGVVKYPNNAPVKEAVVKLFIKRPDNPCELIPVTFTFTDECGQFLFGVEPNVNYVIKVFYYKPENDLSPEKNSSEYE